ncbi:MAG: DEAD/DEAH box helicase [Bacilli bacterium]|nr:DEAD/DEAH box helicase [Bacilli bacterium]MDD4795310.1 DEAD/DEAH box helicase [Bacilli bacterium]
MEYNEIINIMGYNNYYEARMDYREYTFEYDSYYISDIIRVEVSMYHYYDKKKVVVIADIVDSKKVITNVKCQDCNNHNYRCSHENIALLFILANIGKITNIKKQLTSKDLLEKLSHKNMTKANDVLTLEVELINNANESDNSNISFEYEISIKVGPPKSTYMLKTKLKEFLHAYQKKEGILEFGKKFTYDAKTMGFSKEDQKIIEFLIDYYIFYKTIEELNKGRYDYIGDKVKKILLIPTKIGAFLELLTYKQFKINGKKYLGISDKFNPNIKLNKKENNYNLQYDLQDIIPVTPNYEYIIQGNNCYKLDDDAASLTKIMVSNASDNIKFNEKELNDVASIVVPKLKKLSNKLELDKEIEDKFIFSDLKTKYYFDVSHGNIQAKIVSVYGEFKYNPLDKEIKEDKKIVIRNYDKEEESINLLLKHKFILNKNKNFILKEEEDILKFITEGIKEFNTKYDTYVTDKFKKLKIYPKSKVRSNISLGSDELLSYEFSIQNVNTSEIDDLINAVKMRRKYYKLKSGSFINLEDNKELMQFASLVDTLNLTRRDLETGLTKISKYKSLHIDKIMNEEVEFIKSNDEFNNFVNKFKEYKNTDIQLDKSDLNILRDYQVIGVKWLHAIESCGFGGILADEMGLGKTLESIVYINNRIKEDKNRKILIVCPTSLIYNWEAEFDKFAPNLTKLVVNDLKDKRMKLLNQINKFNIIITSYGMLRQDKEEYKAFNFDTMFIDEAQAIKNLNTQVTTTVKEMTAKTKFALTGTPIENSLYELYSIFDFIMPGFMPGITKFTQKYANTIQKNQDANILKEFNSLISPFILRRKKKDVLKDLPDKIETIRVVDLNESQKRLYLSQLENVKKEINEGDFNKDKIKILAAITRLRQICIDPSMFIEDYKDGASKIEAIVDLVESAIEEGHKILLFSQFTSALSIIKQKFNNKNIKYHYLDGSTKSKERLQIVNSFNKDDIKVFMLSLKAGGVGLNLTAADIVIHLDPWWNPQVENQATDRAHRIGQEKIVEVIKMVAKGTIEEKIIKLQEKKKELSDNIIEGDNRSEIVLNRLSEKEFKNLLSI